MPQDYSKYLRDDETLEDVSIGTLRKRKHDDNKFKAKIVPTADEWREEFEEKHAEQYEKAKDYEKAFKAKVEEELQRSISSDDEEGCTIYLVAQTLIAFQKGWVKKVVEGELVLGSYFPDVIGDDIVLGAYKFGLKNSMTFSRAFREVLEILNRHYGKVNTTGDPVLRQAQDDVRAELNGTYVLETRKLKIC